MSILTSTHTGYKYTKWKEDLEEYAEFVLRLSNQSHNKKPAFCQCCYKIPVLTKNGETALDERWFGFTTNYSVERFVTEFKYQALKEIKGSSFELEDVCIPKNLYNIG